MSDYTMVTYHQATAWGPDFRCSERTAAHLDWTKADLPRGCSLRIIQPCFNVGYEPSAGTHDKDAVLDVEVEGMDWRRGERFLRMHRWAAWYRFPPAFTEHIHMVSLGVSSAMVGSLVPAQITDYRNHALGLSGGHTPGSDPTWHPDPILPFSVKLLDRDTPRTPKPVETEWDRGDVYVERLRRRHNGQRILDSDSIRRVQYRLMHHDHVPAKGLKVTGWWDDHTVGAARHFQRVVFDAANPDNRDGTHLTNRQTNRLLGRHGRYNVVEEDA